MKQRGGILHLGYFEGSYVSPHHVHVYSLTQSTSGYSGSRVVTVLGQVSAPYWASVYVARVSQAGHVRRISSCSCPGLVRRFSGLVTYDESWLVHVRWLSITFVDSRARSRTMNLDSFTFVGSRSRSLILGELTFVVSRVDARTCKGVNTSWLVPGKRVNIIMCTDPLGMSGVPCGLDCYWGDRSFFLFSSSFFFFFF